MELISIPKYNLVWPCVFMLYKSLSYPREVELNRLSSGANYDESIGDLV